MGARFLGLDLAWSARNPSGLAALDEHGTLIDACADLRGNDPVLAWIRGHLRHADRGAIAIDMPTVVRNAAGQRLCEGELRGDFHGWNAGPYPANLGLPPFREPSGGRAATLLAALQADCVVHTCDVAPRDARIVAFETFPHAAAVSLFGLRTIRTYKKKRRPWENVLAAWGAFRDDLAGLRHADPPLRLEDDLLPRTAVRQRYKAFDDTIDAVLCAYVASHVWHHGTRMPWVRVYGDMQGGHIVVPQTSRMNPTPGG